MWFSGRAPGFSSQYWGDGQDTGLSVAWLHDTGVAHAWRPHCLPCNRGRCVPGKPSPAGPGTLLGVPTSRGFIPYAFHQEQRTSFVTTHLPFGMWI